MITEEEYIQALRIVEAYHKQILLPNKSPIKPSSVLFRDINLSTRASRILWCAIEERVRARKTGHDLTGYAYLPISLVVEIGLTAEDLTRQRHCGKSTLTEIEKEFKSFGITISSR